MCGCQEDRKVTSEALRILRFIFNELNKFSFLRNLYDNNWKVFYCWNKEKFKPSITIQEPNYNRPISYLVFCQLSQNKIRLNKATPSEQNHSKRETKT